MSTIEIKDYKVLIGNKGFFDIPIKNKEKAYEKIMEMSKNNEYTTGYSLNYDFPKHQGLVALDLKMQIELEDTDQTQQVNFIGRLDKDDGTTLFFINEESEETTFNFSQNFVSII